MKTPEKSGAEKLTGGSPRLRASMGAIGAIGAYLGLAKPVIDRLIRKYQANSEVAENRDPIPIEDDERGREIVKWLDRFKEEHPSVKSVPVYVAGGIPSSLYAPERIFSSSMARDILKKEWGVDQPGVYVRELSAPSALHEMGHAVIDRKIPGISLMTKGISALALPLLAWTIFKKPVANAGFIERYSPAISLGLQIPRLAEEGAASIMAEKTLRRGGESGKDELLPAWAMYLVQAGIFPSAQLAAKLLKRG